MADVIRVPSGPGLLIKDPGPVLSILETACSIHPVNRIIVEGPWPCHDYAGLERGRLKFHMQQIMVEAREIIVNEFPHLEQVALRFDDELFERTDWGAPLDVSRINCQCMDPRLDWLISRLRDRHGDRIHVVRWAGSTAAILDGEKAYGECIAKEYQRLFERIQRDQQTLPLLEMTSHRECAYIGIPDEQEEFAAHRALADNLTGWATRVLRLPVDLAASLLYLDGKVHQFSLQPG